jgi:hypothetical protein
VRYHCGRRLLLKGMELASTRRCGHAGFHTGQARYQRSTRRLRYVVVCDDCLAELRELAEIDYVPVFRPEGGAADAPA